MSRRDRPGDDAPRQDDDDFDFVPLDSGDYELAETPVRWWNKDLGATAVIVGGLGIVSAVVVIVVVYAQTLQPPAPPAPVPPERNVVIQPPAGAPRGNGALEPGNVCTISNLRKSNGPFSGFGGQPALMFDYEFPRGQQRLGPGLLVAVVTEPGGKMATANLSPFLDDSGTMSIATIIGFGAFPRGTSLYIGNRFDEGLDGLPKRVSNILTLE